MEGTRVVMHRHSRVIVEYTRRCRGHTVHERTQREKRHVPREVLQAEKESEA